MSGVALQLNPHQYLKGAKFAAKCEYPSTAQDPAVISSLFLLKKKPGATADPKVPVIINHLGTPTLDDLKDGGAVYWAGMKALAAAGDHVYIKISMLCYLDVAWDQNVPPYPSSPLLTLKPEPNTNTIHTCRARALLAAPCCSCSFAERGRGHALGRCRS